MTIKQLKTEYKIIFSGPVGSGKTTAIQTISDIDVVSTEEAATDATAQIKTNTTVAMDYGVIKMNANERVHLFGTPGQQRFDFMWDILTEGGIGLILLVNNQLDHPLQKLDSFLKSFETFISKTRVVVGLTHTDSAPIISLKPYHDVLLKHGLNTAVFEVDARNKHDVGLLVEALLCSINPETVLNG